MCRGIPKWVMRDGTRIAVTDMETSHVRNALAMLKRDGYVSPATVRFYLGCPGPTAEMAELDFEREAMAAFEAPVSQFVECFECELARREGAPDA